MKKAKFIAGVIIMSMVLNLASALTYVYAGENNIGSWGDNGDGTYNNPLLPGDYSDPDIIRVGDDYYLITSTFQLSPGLTILHSTDLVNWEIINAAVDDISQISKRFNYDQMDRNAYGRGIWAPCLTYNEHNKTFYIHFGTPDEGFFMVKTQDIYGEWSDVIELKRPDGTAFGKGWDDCGVLWDENGDGYFIGTNFDGKYSREKDASEISEGEETTYPAASYQSWLYKLDEDGFTLKDMGVPVHKTNDEYNPSERNPEAYKIFKKDGYYYFYHNGQYGSDRRAWLMKSDSIYGRHENGEAGTFENPGKYEHCPFYMVEGYRGPCQGNVIDADTAEGKKWYFWTHQGATQVDGRPDSLIPIVWDENGWAKADINASGDSGGDMPWENIEKPFPDSEIKRPATSDDFDGEKLGYQWVWNMQPDKSKWSLTERPGYMRMYAVKPLATDTLSRTSNVLLQRMYKTDGNIVTVKIDLTGMADGQNAGLTHSASDTNTCIGVIQENGKRYLRYTTSSGANIRGDELPEGQNEIYFKSEWDTSCMNYFSYSLDGINYKSFGQQYQLIGIKYRGDYVGVYSYNDKGANGYIDVDYLHYQMDSSQEKPMFMGVTDNNAYDEPVNIRWSKGTCTLNGEEVEYDEMIYTPGDYEAVIDYKGEKTTINFTINEGVTKPEIKYPIRINVGGGSCESSVGTLEGDIPYEEGWYGYIGGSTYEYSNSQEEMYKTDRISKTNYEYRFDVEKNGTYKVRLYMMENYHEVAGKRLMSVDIEGKRVENSLDIFKEAGGKNKALVREYTTEVKDKQLNVVFTANLDNASLCGIEILQESVIEPIEENALSDVVCSANDGKINVSGNLLVTEENIGSDCVLILASYTDDGVLDAVKTIDIKDIKEQSTEFSGELESDCRKVSVYAWNSITGMEEFAEKYNGEI